MNNICTPLVMSLNRNFVELMRDGFKNMELRRAFPAKNYRGPDGNANIDDLTDCIRPIYFVQTGTVTATRAALVRVYAEIEKVEFRDISAFYETKRDYFASIDHRKTKYPGYSYGLILRDGGKNYNECLTYKDAIEYQGLRKGLYVILLKNIQKVNFPITELGLSCAPQSFAWAKTTEIIGAVPGKDPREEEERRELTPHEQEDARRKIALLSFILEQRNNELRKKYETDTKKGGELNG